MSWPFEFIAANNWLRLNIKACIHWGWEAPTVKIAPSAIIAPPPPNIKPSKNSAGNRNYRKTDIDLINEIKELLYDRRFTIKGAKQHLKDKNKQSLQVSSDQVKTIKEKVIKLTAADLKTLKRIKSGLEDLLQLVDNLK